MNSGINRRSFLRTTGVIAGGIELGGLSGSRLAALVAQFAVGEIDALHPATAKARDPIVYINPGAPPLDLPKYEGEQYEATVPDTLDIAERARLSVHVMTATTDPLADYEIYWVVMSTNPPAMLLNCWHHGFPKFMWALSLTRMACGSQEGLEVERRWMEVALKSQGPDGLIYLPVKGRPWAFVDWPYTSGVEMPGEQILDAFANGVMLAAMAHYVERDSSPLWKSALRRLVDGITALSIIDGDEAYFLPSLFLVHKERPAKLNKPLGWYESEGGVVPHGLVRAYKALNYEPALTLARKHINFLRNNFYAPDGAFLATPGVPTNAHFHIHGRGLLLMEEYAEAAHDQEMMQFVVRSFERARDFRSPHDQEKTQGAGLVGFFPEWVNAAERQTGETCQIADMIAVALRLSEAGAGDYWDDADRWLRNQFAENQLVHSDWISEYCKAAGAPPKGDHITTDHVAERIVGGFAGAPSPNEWYGRTPGGWFLGQCCTANGAKTLGWIWERILRHKAGKLRVNLLLNRAAPWADVDSHIPYEGRVDVKVKKPVDLSIRIPQWVKPEEARCQVNSMDRPLSWDGRYAVVGNVAPKDIVTLKFPIIERTDKVRIEGQEYTLTRKGNDVIHINPPGTHCPLYQREKYRDNTAQTRKVTRFVAASQEIDR